MTIHIAHGPLKFDSLWWSLRCTGIDASRKDELHEEVEDWTPQWFDDCTGQPS